MEPSFDDRRDFENASRGLIDSLKPCRIKSAAGGIAWDNDAYSFLEQDQCPPTVNPKLWRQSQLGYKQGLFEVCPGIYQIRGFDLSNMTIVEGKSGIVVIDPLTSNETAAAALELYRKNRGARPVTGMIFSHSHADHFGGAVGILDNSKSTAKTIPIIAPEFFLEEATSENVLVGPAMRQRAGYMYGKSLPVSPEGQVGCSIGLAVSKGRLSLVPPNKIIKRTGEEMVVDGVKIVFQLVPHTEAPAEMNMFFPDHRTLLIAECATHCMHNIITLRGTVVRDAKEWGRYLDETMVLYGEASEILISSHLWPTWGKAEICKMISEQRDLYIYLHDQTIRMMNMGLNGTEIAEKMQLPTALRTAWHTQGFYGSVSHNVKGIYQRYMTWFDGNPANLWKHPPAEEANRYVECMGGLEESVRKANRFAEDGDLRFAATLLDHVTQADPHYIPGREALASVYTKLGYGAENATWRNFYLSKALDLRKPPTSAPARHGARVTVTPHLSVVQWLDCLSVALDGVMAGDDCLAIGIDVVDQSQKFRINVSNGAMTTRVISKENSLRNCKFTLRSTRDQLYQALNGDFNVAREQGSGDFSIWQRLMKVCGIALPEPRSTL